MSFLLAQANRAGGALEIVAIGPLTNLAEAIRADPAFAAKIRRVWLMGGRFEHPDRHPAEHNFASDAVAADEVLRSGLPITVLGIEVTQQLRLLENDVAALGADGTAGPLGVQLERETRAWMAYWNEDYDVPHDATTVIRMLRPDLFTERPLRVRVESNDEQAGRVLPVGADQPGPVIDVVTGLDVPAVTREILARIRTASQRTPAPPPAPKSS